MKNITPALNARYHRLVDHALELVVVADLHIAGHREVLAQRIAVEAVIGEDAAQVRVALEEDAVHVEGFALVPVGGGIDLDDRGNGGVLVGLQLDPDARVPGHRQQMVDHVETPRALRIVHPADVDQHLETMVVAKRAHGRDDLRKLRRDSEVAIGHLRAGEDARAIEHQGLADRLQLGVGLRPAHRTMVPVRRIFFCSCSTP
jgi:hypothetical protein